MKGDKHVWEDNNDYDELAYWDVEEEDVKGDKHVWEILLQWLMNM